MKTTITILAVSLCLGLAGCSQDSKDQYSQAGQDISQGTQKAGQALSNDAKKAAGEASQAAASAGSQLRDAADKTKIAAANDLESGKVKTALSSAAGLSANDISVDTDSVSKTITLGGSVPDAKQKAQAESVVKSLAGSEFKVVSNLKAAA